MQLRAMVEGLRPEGLPERMACMIFKIDDPAGAFDRTR